MDRFWFDDLEPRGHGVALEINWLLVPEEWPFLGYCRRTTHINVWKKQNYKV